jgi:hypothetical protein
LLLRTTQDERTANKVVCWVKTIPYSVEEHCEFVERCGFEKKLVYDNKHIKYVWDASLHSRITE